MKHRLRILNFEKALYLRHNNIPYVFVGLYQTAKGVECEVCGSIHADIETAEKEHDGPGVIFIIEEIVEARTDAPAGPAAGYFAFER